MSTPILATNLYISRPRPKIVRLPHLLQRLNEDLHHSSGVTLICAPASFGKTALVGSLLTTVWASLVGYRLYRLGQL